MGSCKRLPFAVSGRTKTLETKNRLSDFRRFFYFFRIKVGGIPLGSEKIFTIELCLYHKSF